MTSEQGEAGPGQTLCAGRFQIERELGAGGMGAVYAAWDHHNHHWVALKLISRPDAEGMYRIKREFRGFASVRHRNLLELYELIEDEGRFYFTMELVDGEMLLDVLHPSPGGLLDDPDGEPEVGVLPPTPATDMARLRHAFHQVAEALTCLHAAHKLHRDLKPENVLVDAADRAVVLDFGIGASRGPDGALDTLGETLMGTPAYMAAEAMEGEADARSDWYAFGVMLYEALVGQLPFDDHSVDTLYWRKRHEEPLPPNARVRGVPEDLADLALALLSRDPAARPTGADVLEKLAAEHLDPDPAITPPPEPSRFVGRTAQLEALAQALSDVADEQPRVALIHGPSGIGKSSLVRHLLAARRTGPADRWLLSGRCYAPESVRFKAFDGVVDALSRYLLALPSEQVAGLLPRRLGALVAVFPVLGRVPLMGRERRPSRFEVPADPADQRKHAFGALRELLARVAQRWELVLYIDDLQWGDVDSIALLRSLIIGEGAPALSLLCTYRSDEVNRSPCLRALLQVRDESPELFVDVPVPPLADPEAAELGRLLVQEFDPDEVEGFTREAAGNPFVLTQLVLHRGDLEQRLSGLSRDARALIELLSVAGRPLPRSVYSVLREQDVDLQAALSELQRTNLVRSTGARGGLCPYHDRVREQVVSQIPSARRAELQGHIARVLEAQPDADLEALLHHWIEAGETQRAAAYAALAANRAAARFAFERAASLYRFALSHVSEDPERQQALRYELAAVLALNGHRAEAAEVYLAGAEQAQAPQAADMRQRAGQELLLSGHAQRGIELLRGALDEVGAPLHDDVRDALQAWREQHKRLVERGLQYTARSARSVDPAVAMRLDTLWAAAFGLNRIEGVRVYAVLAQLVREALDGGDTLRVVRALCMYHLIADYPTHLLGGKLLGARTAAEALAPANLEPMCDAWLLLAQAFELWYRGDPRSIQLLRDAEHILHERCVGVAPELGFVRQMILGQYQAAGAWDRAIAECMRFDTDAAARNDRLQDVAFNMGRLGILRPLMQGRVEAARDAIENLLRAAPAGRVELVFPVHFVRGNVASVTGDLSVLREHLEWTRAFARRPVTRLKHLRAAALLNIGRAAAALARHTTGSEREAALEEADGALTEASAQGIAALAGTILVARAAVAAGRSYPALAEALLEASLEQMPEFAGLVGDLARYHLCRLRGEEGDSDGPKAEASLRKRGVEDIATVSAALFPLLDSST